MEELQKAIELIKNDESVKEVRVDLGNGFGVILITREGKQIHMGKERTVDE